MDLKNYREWDKTNGTLSVSMKPHTERDRDKLFVVLNGNVGNFCLDYSEESFDKKLAIQRAWSSDTGYYVKINDDRNVKLVRWWDGIEEELDYSFVSKHPKQFYDAITKNSSAPAGSTIVNFSKGAFLRLRNGVKLKDNGKVSLRTFMYLLAALKDNVRKPEDVNAETWQLNALDYELFDHEVWEDVYNGFRSGIDNRQPLVDLVLRHASNRLFQEAHREATREGIQTVIFGTPSRKYDSGISEGAYYTPTAIVRTIVQEVLSALDRVKPINERQELKILDPACGSSEFLREALRQLKMLDYSGNVSVTGWDISDIACEMSRFVLNYENMTEWNSDVRVSIENRDSLLHNWNNDGQYDIILMNPPFNSFENLLDKKTIVKEKLTGLVKGQPDLAAVFWKNATDVLSDQGALGIILPNSLLNGPTYEGLRRYIKETNEIEFSLLGRLGSAALFEKAMIIPSIQVGTKRSSSNTHTVVWTNHELKSTYDAFRHLRIYRAQSISTPVNRPNYSIYENRALTSTNNFAWSISSLRMFRIAERLNGFDTVGRFFKIKRGVDAGNNAAFLIAKDNLMEYPKSVRNYFRPCIMRDSIKEGRLIDKWYLFYPYGKNKIESQGELIEKLGKYYLEKLQPNRESLKKRRGKSEKWWELNEPRLEWQLEMKPKLVSSYFGKSGYFAYDDEGKYLVGQSFAWLPVKGKEKLDSKTFYLSYLALLHAPIMDLLFEMVSVNIAGGQFDFSKHYLEKMPLPDLTHVENSILLSLEKFGKQIHAGEEADMNQLNKIVADCYTLNIEELN